MGMHYQKFSAETLTQSQQFSYILAAIFDHGCMGTIEHGEKCQRIMDGSDTHASLFKKQGALFAGIGQALRHKFRIGETGFSKHFQRIFGVIGKQRAGRKRKTMFIHNNIIDPF